MRRARLSLAVLTAVLGLAPAACVVQSAPTTGDLTLHYTFDQQTCAAAGVTEIDIAVDGVSVSDGATLKVDCATYAGGADIQALSLGTYTVEIQGLDGSGHVLYDLGAQTVDLKGGSNIFSFDLPAVTGTLELGWTFAGSPVCGQVATVHVVVLDAQGSSFDDHTYPCTDGTIIYQAVAAGAYTVGMQGIDGSGQVLYAASNKTVQVLAGQDNAYSIDLN